MQKITLYTKLECSLCDQAYKVLLAVALDVPMAIDVVDIFHGHTNLEARYGSRIPVAALDNGTEIDWPFTSEDIVSLLQ
jgi:hypothetical protein